MARKRKASPKNSAAKPSKNKVCRCVYVSLYARVYMCVRVCVCMRARVCMFVCVSLRGDEEKGREVKGSIWFSAVGPSRKSKAL